MGHGHSVATTSCTSAITLALRILGVGPGDEVFCPTLTFVASCAPIVQMGGIPIFIDSDQDTWNMDADLLEQELLRRAATGKKMPKCAIVVHLYGQCGDLERILSLYQQYEIPVIEDIAESLGALYQGKKLGTFGTIGVFSFNGNKIITTSMGGMLWSGKKAITDRALFIATQARDPSPHYEHSELGYNFRISNLLAAVGVAQLELLEERVAARCAIFDRYQEALGQLPGITFIQAPPGCYSTRWLTCFTVEESQAGVSSTTLIQALMQAGIESRRVWKPMHLQPIFHNATYIGGNVAKNLFLQGLCLPSGSNLSLEQQNRVLEVIHRFF